MVVSDESPLTRRELTDLTDAINEALLLIGGIEAVKHTTKAHPVSMLIATKVVYRHTLKHMTAANTTNFSTLTKTIDDFRGLDEQALAEEINTAVDTAVEVVEQVQARQKSQGFVSKN